MGAVCIITIIATAIGWIYLVCVNPKEPSPWLVDIGGLLNVHNVVRT